ncbi:MAG TPA: hypothetical protein VEV17_02075 [Bryobacteraceae bacterium]|nr:hypothetical protein [Bryobacteraceae bacterium]
MQRLVGALMVAAVVLQPGAGQESSRLTFEAKVSDLGLQTGSFARNKKPDDIVQVTLPGHKIAPPRAVPLIRRADAKWASPESCVDSIRSANTAGDAAWILENFAPGDQADVRRLVSDPDLAKRNQDYYKSVSKAEIMALVDLREYRVAVLREETVQAKAVVVPLTMVKTPAGWRQTNALSKDETFDVLWAAVRSGGMR